MAKILVVDDDRNLADTIAELLGHHGYDAWVAYDGDDALTQLLAEFPQADRQQLRQLVRNALAERKANRPPHAFRELFRVLREMSEKSEV